MYIAPFCSFSTLKQMRKAISVQSECTFVWDVLVTTALEGKGNMPSSIYRGGRGCYMYLHIIIVIGKSNFPYLWALLLHPKLKETNQMKSLSGKKKVWYKGLRARHDKKKNLFKITSIIVTVSFVYLASRWDIVMKLRWTYYSVPNYHLYLF